LWAFDSLYVVVNGGGKKGAGRPNGLYRVRASTPGGELDQVAQLATVRGGGEHGPHAVLLAPDGKSLFCVCGNDTKLYSPLAGSMLPKLWDDDLLFPYIARFSGVVPPAGCIYRVDPDGQNWELWSAGYRNAYDAAFNRHGELFTFDSDMEWDMNTPWYRPTRIMMAASGSDFGFRNGSNVLPPRYPDTLPAIYDVGPGSPTGVCFGYGAKFPAKYQEALFACDWSYGRLFAAHLTPDGCGYQARVEEFAMGTPLALTDLVVNPQDGALYFTVGGRNTQSALYRIAYTGNESTAPSTGTDAGAEARALRRRLEAFHGKPDPRAAAAAWPYLSHQDRYIRFAARVAIEHQPYQEWQTRALQEPNPVAAIHALLALARAAGKDSDVRADLKGSMLEALGRLDWEALSDSQRCDLLRVYTVLFSRLGRTDEVGRARVLALFEPCFPTKNPEVNADLCQLLVYLEAPSVAGKALKLIGKAPSQEEQMEYVKSLRNLKTGWTLAQRKDYFAWFQKAAGYRGGLRFQQYVQEIRRDALATLSAAEKEALPPILAAKATTPAATVAKPRPLVKQWTLDELAPIVENGLSTRDFDRGRLLFGEAKCFACHRFANEGGALAPDLTVVSGRYSARDFLDKILNPSKAVSDQYAATVFTLKDGRVIVGRVVNLQGDNLSIQTDMLSPARLTRLNVKNVEATHLSDVSLMPTGLLDSFHADEILDLMAYVLSRGDRPHAMFQQAGKGSASGGTTAAELPRSGPGRAPEPLILMVDLWPGGKAPGQTSEPGPDTVNKSKSGKVRLTNVTRAQLKVYLPANEKNTGTALLIAPGGGFKDLGWDFEGETMAKWCTQRGVAGIILKYRVPRGKGGALDAFLDGQRAVSFVRRRAREWGIDPQRIGMIGFSAGGSVTNYVLLNSDKRGYEPVDEHDKASPRLDYAVLVYSAGGFGSKEGKNSLDGPAITKEKIPPIFMCAAYNDGIAANMMQSFIALKKAGVPAEIHIYATGGHAFGGDIMNPPVPLVGDWWHRLEAWMRYQKLLAPKKAP
jgi:putative heme-binding domain-containing protein